VEETLAKYEPGLAEHGRTPATDERSQGGLLDKSAYIVTERKARAGTASGMTLPELGGMHLITALLPPGTDLSGRR
jgi:hypothetical protein